MSKHSLDEKSHGLPFAFISLLALSLALNLGLGVTLFLRVSSERVRPALSKFIPVRRTANTQIIHLYEGLSLQDLIRELRNHSQAEEGFKYSDLALGSLVAIHHFDLVRALPGKEHMLRYVAYRDLRGEEKTLPLYLGLTESEKDLIFHFATSHKWPLDSFGIFLKLKESPNNRSLLEAFSKTRELGLIYEALKNLSKEGGFGQKVSLDAVISSLLPNAWEEITMLATHISLASSDLSALDALLSFAMSSKGDSTLEIILDAAAPLILKYKGDKEVVNLLKKFTTLSPVKVRFATKLLFSQRSDEVHYYAASLISLAADKELPRPFDRIEALKILFPALTSSLEKGK